MGWGGGGGGGGGGGVLLHKSTTISNPMRLQNVTPAVGRLASTNQISERCHMTIVSCIETSQSVQLP